MNTFNLGGHPYIELHSLLKVIGLAESGGAAKMCIAEGQVRVDSVIELRKRCKIHAGQSVAFAGTTITVAD